MAEIIEKIEFKCPHCGWVYDGAKYPGLVPYHNYPMPLTRQVCKGSKQNPRGLSDMRPLWKDEQQQEDKDGRG